MTFNRVKFSGIVIKDQDRNIDNNGKGMPDHSRLLLHAIDGINKTLQLKEVLRKCMEAAKVVMNSEASSLMLLDELTGDLNVSIATGPVKDEVMGMSVPKNKGIGGWVISYNQPFISNDVVESDVFWKDLSTDFTTHNIICVPLKDSEGNAFGVLQAINKKGDKLFESKDVPVFESLALHVSSAIERSRKFDEMEKKLLERDLEIVDIQERLSENLLTISDILEFDLNKVKDKHSKRILKAVIIRIKSVIEAHFILSQASESNSIDLSKYLGFVASQIENIFEDSGKDIRLSMRFEPIVIDFKRSLVCGLILNELVTTAYENASSTKEIGEVIVSLKKTGKDKIVLIVTDSGLKTQTVKPTKKDDEIGPEFIVKNLAEKLHGEITYTHNPEIGSTSILSFHI